MAIVVESTANASTTASVDLVITKPTGLAEGDLLIAALTSRSGEYTTPSGWTQADVRADTVAYSEILYKVASSADAAASNFTFTSDSAIFNSGSLLRVSGAVPTPQITADGLVSDSGPIVASFTVTGTPRVGSLGVMVGIATNANATGSGSVTSYNSPPLSTSWVETHDYFYDGEEYSGAAYNEVDPTAALTSFGYATTNTGRRNSGVIAFFNEVVDATATNTLVTAASSTFTQTGTSDTITLEQNFLTASATVNEQTAVGTTPQQWIDETKLSTDWTNEQKT